jgi:hypothetical protein
MILIDTPIWSKYTRKRRREQNKAVIDVVARLLYLSRGCIIGAVLNLSRKEKVERRKWGCIRGLRNLREQRTFYLLLSPFYLSCRAA